VFRLGEGNDVGPIYRSARRSLHPDQIVAFGDRDRMISKLDHK
jgi:hypothetical protein